MKDMLLKADESTRRSFLQGIAATSLGVTMPAVPARESHAATSKGSPKPTADAVIQIFLGGGMSHVDTFDVKTHPDVSYGVKPIATNVDGIQVSELFPKVAKQMDKLTIVRSTTSTLGAHSPASYFMNTSYERVATTIHPRLGAWASKFRPSDNPHIPTYITVGGGTSGRGFFGSEHGALPMLDPNGGLPNSVRTKRVTEEDFERRISDLEKLNKAFNDEYNKDSIRSNTKAYGQALALMQSEELAAFDIKHEDRATLAAYGNGRLAQGCLLARRLVEAGARFIGITHGSWDHHVNISDGLPPKAKELDHALSTLLDDLAKRGMLNRTLVAVRTEFGRGPHIVQSAGRGHYPAAFTSLLAGGGIKGGHVYGKTDETGRKVIENPVTHPDVAATMATALGLDVNKIVLSPGGRPFQVSHKGQPIKGVFA